MLNYIIPFIILILVVVFIHEYGHYYFAKRYGVDLPLIQNKFVGIMKVLESVIIKISKVTKF